MPCRKTKLSAPGQYLSAANDGSTVVQLGSWARTDRSNERLLAAWRSLSRAGSRSISIAVHELPSLGLQLLQFCRDEGITPHS